MTVQNLKRINKGTLLASLDLETSSGLIFRGVLVHQRDGKRWVQVPGIPFQKADGSKAYKPVIEFASHDRFRAFNAAALEAITPLLTDAKGAV